MSRNERPIRSNMPGEGHAETDSRANPMNAPGARATGSAVHSWL